MSDRDHFCALSDDELGSCCRDLWLEDIRELEVENERLRAWLYLIAHWPDNPRPLASDALSGKQVPTLEENAR